MVGGACLLWGNIAFYVITAARLPAMLWIIKG